MKKSYFLQCPTNELTSYLKSLLDITMFSSWTEAIRWKKVFFELFVCRFRKCLEHDQSLRGTNKKMIETNSVLIPRESIEESPQWNESKIFYIDHGQSVSHKKFRAKLAEGNKVSYTKSSCFENLLAVKKTSLFYLKSKS